MSRRSSTIRRINFPPPPSIFRSSPRQPYRPRIFRRPSRLFLQATTIRRFTFLLPITTSSLRSSTKHEQRRAFWFRAPGTGKSHTIANLICHNLAEGKRILITSQSPRALQMTSRTASRGNPNRFASRAWGRTHPNNGLERCVGRIIDKDTKWKDAVQVKKIAELRKELHEKKSDLAELKNRERDIREKEIKPFSLGSERYSGTMAEIAASVNRDAERLDWFTDSITSGDCLMGISKALRAPFISPKPSGRKGACGNRTFRSPEEVSRCGLPAQKQEEDGLPGSWP